jgi:hypothetical protein
MARAAIVLDINGVLADVRKKSQPAVPQGRYSREDQFVMPNTQRVFLRPGALDFLAEVTGGMAQAGGGVVAGVWTSRLRKNAVPILQWLEGLMRTRHARCAFQFSFLLSGEDCMEVRRGGEFASNPYKPTLIKPVSTLRARLEPAGILLPRANLLFLDDHPAQLEMDYYSWYVGCDTFDALYAARDTRPGIEHMISRKDIVLGWLRERCQDRHT